VRESGDDRDQVVRVTGAQFTTPLGRDDQRPQVRAPPAVPGPLTRFAVELVGGCLFRTFDTGIRTCELGVWLSADAEGRGLITRACRDLIDWAIDARGMNRVEWQCVPHNKRSIAVAERLGMTRDGVLRQSFPFNDEMLDVEVWSLLAGER
jgi:RimJ/RimL family protein N-acetyltransferase